MLEIWHIHFHIVDVFNQPVNNWNTSSVVLMCIRCFMIVGVFNQPIDNWDTSNMVTSMSSIFEYVGSLISQNSWDGSKVSATAYTVMVCNFREFNHCR